MRNAYSGSEAVRGVAAVFVGCVLRFESSTTNFLKRQTEHQQGLNARISILQLVLPLKCALPCYIGKHYQCSAIPRSPLPMYTLRL